MCASPGPVWPLSASRRAPSLSAVTSPAASGPTRPEEDVAALAAGDRQGMGGEARLGREQGVGDARAGDGVMHRLAGLDGVAGVGGAHLGQDAGGAEGPRDGLEPRAAAPADQHHRDAGLVQQLQGADARAW